jgi:hypothetical protein
VTGRRRRPLRGLLARLRPHVPAACRCPACDTAEQKARAQLGMPARHPERIIRALSDRQEEQLAAAASQMWPEDEYTAIVAEFLNGGGQP